MSKEFVATGFRRFGVAIVGITACAVVDTFGKAGLSWPGCIGIGLVVLGYYNTKYAEVLAQILPALMEKFFGKKGT